MFTFWILLATFISGVLSLVGGALLLWKGGKSEKYEIMMTSFGAGVLMTLAVMDLIPETFSEGDPELVSWSILIGVIILFVMEKTSIWWHHHHETHEVKVPTITGLILGDTIHNFIDGMAIAASFAVDTRMGIVTAIGVALHELPQEIADFGLCLKAGLGAKKTLWLNFISSLASVLGAVIALSLGTAFANITVYLVAATAGMFLYISLADLVPELHRRQDGDSAYQQLAIFILGVMVAILSLYFEF